MAQQRILYPRSYLSSFLAGCTFFIAMIVLANLFEREIIELFSPHQDIGILAFLGITVLATVIPMWGNLALVPIAVLLWGPWITSILLFVGWNFGSVASFWLARKLRFVILKRSPSFQQYSFIDTLISRERPLLSLVVLRMTFPVDILSYALGIFSDKVTARANLLSTLIGVVPFTLFFSFVPMLSSGYQYVFFGLTTLGFLIYYLYRMKKASSTETTIPRL